MIAITSNFRIQIVIRISLVLLFAVSAFYFGVYTPFSLMVFWMVLFSGLTLFELIRYVEKSNRDLTNFLMAIKQNDFSNIYSERDNRSKSLYNAFNVITKEFIKLRSEKETNFHFFKTVVEHSRVPLLAYQLADERVTMMNEAARDLFHIPYLSRLDSLKKVSQEVYDTTTELGSDKKVLLKTHLDGKTISLSVVAKVIVLQEQTFKVLAYYNLNSELDQQEIESWQKLIRVLTHEIKNSVIPISTLSEVIYQMITNDDGTPRPVNQLDDEDEDDLRVSLRTIEKRSKGLVKFVNSYGDLARTPKLDLEHLEAVSMLDRILELEAAELSKRKIELVKEFFSNKIELVADASAIEQVLINVIKNAMEALEDTSTPKLTISIKEEESQTVIGVEDNGPGIDEETLSNIFVPFYTTKKEGSGIGLPLSRQIMKAHGGNITVQSKVGQGTRFELTIPKRA